jgi:hypothetical protein
MDSYSDVDGTRRARFDTVPVVDRKMDQMDFNHTEALGWSRNYEPGVFQSYRKSGAVQKFWTSCISFLQKIWGSPEILDQLYFIHTENLGGPEILDRL